MKTDIGFQTLHLELSVLNFAPSAQLTALRMGGTNPGKYYLCCFLQKNDGARQQKLLFVLADLDFQNISFGRVGQASSIKISNGSYFSFGVFCNQKVYPLSPSARKSIRRKRPKDAAGKTCLDKQVNVSSFLPPSVGLERSR